MAENVKPIEPYLIPLIASRLGSISANMNNALIKGARSSVLALARDCSTAICDAKGRVLVFPAGFPVHVGCSTLSGQALLELHGRDLKPGDAYLNNSPYHGNTHAADHTIMVPVFHEDELMFITLCRGHQADIGNSIPTTYHATARDVYEEGALIFPCVQIQRGYKDIADIIRMCRMRIRVPDVWYGDYLAIIGAARIGERELLDLAKKYGADTIRTFCREYHEYGRRRMKKEIAKIPKGRVSYSTRHDPIPGILPEGVEVKVQVEADPDDGRIICDFTDNEDSKHCGLNLSEGTLTSAARTGVLNRLSVKLSEFPTCEGALERIEVRMREGSIVGKSKHPFSSSVATTNVNDRAVLAVQCALNQLTPEMGMAEPHLDIGLSCSVISGTDSRYGNRPYVTQLISGDAGGPGVNGHDGYLHHCISNSGMQIWNSIEMIENQYPVMYLKQELVTDGLGPGQWDGAPAVETVIKATTDDIKFIHVADGKINPAKGAAGGGIGVPARIFRCRVKQGIDYEPAGELPTIGETIIRPGEAIAGISSSSGGYGNPLDRDPEAVRCRVLEGWVTVEMAREIYGVILVGGQFKLYVDRLATKQLRDQIRNIRT